jgi:hypothetical protein
MTLFGVFLTACFILISWLLCLEAYAKQSRAFRPYIITIVISPDPLGVQHSHGARPKDGVEDVASISG